ncbi:MAG: cellobiose phosphorylase, partial [Candidatus Firestonebacteria bacterium]|nr:cellobiose phosphorylase [Candidatus Firestonebacteria bacterium]
MEKRKVLQNKQMQSQAAFTLRDYNAKAPFAGFLPGIGGKFGIPTWAFYVNRGQGICSFGTQDKDHALMEYLPATQAYQLANHQGFRTFLKIHGGRNPMLYEPFQYARKNPLQIEQEMTVSADRILLRDHNPQAGLETTVEFFSLLNENVGGLMRILTLQNAGPRPLELEVADGLPVLLPFGLEEDGLKNRRYLMEAFMGT